MKRLMYVLAIALIAITTGPVTADTDARSVTGAATAAFGVGAALGAVDLQGVELGTGVFIEADGSASGAFHAVLKGTSLGFQRAMTLDGKAALGSVGSDGRATFSGTASLDLGDGLPPLPDVPFSVTAGTDGLVLAIDSTTLPAAGLTSGAVTIE